MAKMTARERNDFEGMCNTIIQAINDGEVETKIGNDYDGRYYTRLANEHPRLLKKMTGLQDYYTRISTNCGINFMLCWPDSEELQIKRAKKIIEWNKKERVADLYGGCGCTYWITGREVAIAIDNNTEEIEKACGIENLETYGEYNNSGREVFCAAWTLPGDELE